jgi:hypothetical protein
MKGISYFLEDLSEFKYKLSNSGGYSMSPEAEYDVTDLQATDPQSEPSRGRQSQQSPSPSTESASRSPPQAEAADDDGNTSGNVLPRFVRDNKSGGKEGPEPSEDNTRRIFTQASQLLREQAKATGCVFVDAASGVFSSQSEQGSSPPSSVNPTAGLDLNFDLTEGQNHDASMARDVGETGKRSNTALDDDMSHMAHVLR